jgi:hypothetical protein
VSLSPGDRAWLFWRLQVLPVIIFLWLVVAYLAWLVVVLVVLSYRMISWPLRRYYRRWVIRNR